MTTFSQANTEKKSGPMDPVMSAKINYIQPDYTELRHRFPEHVSDELYNRTFEAIDRCHDVWQITQQVILIRQVNFVYVSVDKTRSSETVYCKMEDQKVRPALYEELIGFASLNPREQTKHPIAALGSVVRVNTRLYIACLDAQNCGLCLRLQWIEAKWPQSTKFLAVREPLIA